MLPVPANYSGTTYTATFTLLAIAFLASPAVIALSWPISNAALLVVLSASVTSAGLAVLSWRSHSSLTVPSILPRGSRRK